MRIFISIATFAVIASGASAQQTYSNEPNTYRYGGTYKTVNASTPNSCASLCGQEQVCLAWSYQRQTRGFGGARCELKSTIGRAVNNPLMISGISPQLSSQGQAAQRSPQSTGTLLGGPSTQAPQTFIRNSSTSTPLSAPRALTPAPAPVQRPAPPPVQTFTSPQPAPTIRAIPQPAPLQNIAPPPPPAAVRPAQPNLQPGEFVSPVPPAPVGRTLPPPPTSPPLAAQPPRIQVPVTQGDLPPGSVLRNAPPPQISFAPPEATPLPATPPVPVAPAPVQSPETITLPRSSKSTQRAPRQLQTVPAGSIPAPVATPATPYNNLRNQTVPSFSVNNDTVPTPEELEAADKASREIIEKVELDSVDLAEDVGQPIGRDLVEERRRANTGGGGGS